MRLVDRVSTPAIVTGFHDVVYRRPAAELRRLTDEVRSLIGNNRASRSAPGDVRPLRLGMPVSHDLQVILGGMGPRTRRIAALHGDGWYPVYIARDLYLDQWKNCGRSASTPARRRLVPHVLLARNNSDELSDPARRVRWELSAWAALAMTAADNTETPAIALRRASRRRPAAGTVDHRHHPRPRR